MLKTPRSHWCTLIKHGGPIANLKLGLHYSEGFWQPRTEGTGAHYPSKTLGPLPHPLLPNNTDPLDRGVLHRFLPLNSKRICPIGVAWATHLVCTPLGFVISKIRPTLERYMVQYCFPISYVLRYVHVGSITHSEYTIQRNSLTTFHHPHFKALAQAARLAALAPVFVYCALVCGRADVIVVSYKEEKNNSVKVITSIQYIKAQRLAKLSRFL